MLDKPDDCIGCPLYGDGKGFVPGVFPPGARLLIAAQNPGREEEEAGEPLVGATGKLAASTYVPLTGEDWGDVARDNVIRCRWAPGGKRTNELPTGRTLDDALVHCRVHDRLPDSIELVLCMGAVALKKYAPTLKMGEWRGHLLPEETYG